MLTMMPIFLRESSLFLHFLSLRPLQVMLTMRRGEILSRFLISADKDSSVSLLQATLMLVVVPSMSSMHYRPASVIRLWHSFNPLIFRLLLTLLRIYSSFQSLRSHLDKSRVSFRSCLMNQEAMLSGSRISSVFYLVQLIKQQDLLLAISVTFNCPFDLTRCKFLDWNNEGLFGLLSFTADFNRFDFFLQVTDFAHGLFVSPSIMRLRSCFEEPSNTKEVSSRVSSSSKMWFPLGSDSFQSIWTNASFLDSSCFLEIFTNLLKSTGYPNSTPTELSRIYILFA